MFYGNMFFLNISVPMLQAMYTEHLDIIMMIYVRKHSFLCQFGTIQIYILPTNTHIYIDLNVLVAKQLTCVKMWYEHGVKIIVSISTPCLLVI